MRERQYTRPYVIVHEDGSREVVRAVSDPSEYPGGAYAIGPFRTRRAAELCACGAAPLGTLSLTVYEYERLAKRGS